ncbi:HlyC/CorC family transporter [candidate division KSB1 bacterium]|nr:MAG: HlyC/CorC family transporter [candidate division KSB1 bacterium]
MSTFTLLMMVFILGIYFSAMETAYTSFDRILTVSWLRSRRFGAHIVEILSSKPERFLSTTLIGNNICNVAYSSLLVLLADAAGIHQIWLVTVSPIIVLIFSEIMPKMMGYYLANRIVRYFSFPLLIIYYLLLPLRLLLLPLIRVLARKDVAAGELLSGDSFQIRKELDQVLVGAEDEGAATPEEGEILSRYLDARDLKVRQIMTPRTQMVAVPVDMTPAQVRDVFRKCRHNILPVFQGDVDHVIGYVSARDFLFQHHSVRDVLQPMHAVPESKKISDLLQEFKTERRQVALVIDEYGGTDGLVTLKDIFEELVGPVAERWDPAAPVIKQVAPGKFLVSGSAFLEDIHDVTGWQAKEGDYNTLSGFLSEYLGRIAELGEDINIDTLRLESSVGLRGW